MDVDQALFGKETRRQQIIDDHDRGDVDELGRSRASRSHGAGAPRWDRTRHGWRRSPEARRSVRRKAIRRLARQRARPRVLPRPTRRMRDPTRKARSLGGRKGCAWRSVCRNGWSSARGAVLHRPPSTGGLQRNYSGVVNMSDHRVIWLIAKGTNLAMRRSGATARPAVGRALSSIEPRPCRSPTCSFSGPAASPPLTVGLKHLPNGWRYTSWSAAGG